jgi:ribosomal-protein-serine acetyltransferase
MQPITIGTDLELRPLEEHYAGELFAIIDRDREYLHRWQNWPDGIRSWRDMRQLIRRSIQKKARNNGFDMVILYKGNAVGKTGLVYVDWEGQCTEIGYWLGQDYQGRGFVTRAARVLVGYALGEMRLTCVRIRCAVGNTRSKAIPERLGFSYKGTIPGNTWLREQMVDDDIYIMNAPVWYRHMIYHITTENEWNLAQRTDEYRAVSLAAQGFIHMSDLQQVTKVANAVYAAQSDLVLLCIDPKRLRMPVKYEPPDTNIPAAHYEGELFPHLYGALNTDAVISAMDFPPAMDGTFTLPDCLPVVE